MAHDPVMRVETVITRAGVEILSITVDDLPPLGLLNRYGASVLVQIAPARDSDYPLASAAQQIRKRYGKEAFIVGAAVARVTKTGIIPFQGFTVHPAILQAWPQLEAAIAMEWLARKPTEDDDIEL